MTHTPGPWQVTTEWSQTTGDCFRIKDAKESEIEANTRLIAASPDMLEILEKLVGGRMVGCSCGICLYCKAARVLRKAKGEK